LPAPTVNFTVNTSTGSAGATANLVGVVTGPDVPGGKGRQYIYWNGIRMPAGATGQIVAKGARNESYAKFTVAPSCPPLGTVRGSAFEDYNLNGVRDPGEPGIGAASWKVTAGGNWFICGYVGGDSTYGPTVTPGTYSVIPIAQPGWRATTPPRIALVKQLGVAALNNDLGFIRDPRSSGDFCGQYAPPNPNPIPPPITSTPIPSTLASYRIFNTLLAAANASGVIDILNEPGPYTLFAPTDAAFTKLPAGTLDRLLKHPLSLAELLKCHIVPGIVEPSDFTRRAASTQTLGARRVILRATNGSLTVNGRNIAEVLDASNGEIYIIDAVLFISRR
jgi:hypothetical protein